MTTRKSKLFSGMGIRRLRRWLLLFFLAIAIPTVLLIYQTYSQLKWESFHQQRVLAEELSERIESRFSQIIDVEQARPFTDYAFLNLAGDPAANFLQRSPLSEFPLGSSIPGLTGYFQVGAAGDLSTPYIPVDSSNLGSYGISAAELRERNALQEGIYQILSQNRLLDEAGASGGKTAVDKRRLNEQEFNAPVAMEKDEARNRELVASDRRQAEKQKPVRSQAAFDQLEQAAPKKISKSTGLLGRVDDLQLTEDYDNESPAGLKKQDKSAIAENKARKELSTLPIISEETTGLARDMPAFTEDEVTLPASVAVPRVGISTFESEIDPLVFSQLDSGHFVLFRKVWRNGERIIQGLLIEQDVFLGRVINTTFQKTSLSLASNLLVAYRGDVISVYSGRSSGDYLSGSREFNQLSGQVLYRSRLNEPFAELELLFNINSLPPGPGAGVVGWLSVILMLILSLGFFLMYRLAARQILLARQQQDFVSAVSHELKTPLTSIRMYGEMLKQGWAAEDKKHEYYEYIYTESERLTRLINNVLQLARMSRNEQQASLSINSVEELIALVESKVSSQIERAGFELKLECSTDVSLNIDVDWFTQIVLNLVDNAIKFSMDANNKTIDISCRQLRDNTIIFSVRDYGPGIEKEQMKSIFKLFYRTENEATRNTIGTGIGLALVNQMTWAMGGSIDVVNKHPGAEFRLSFPVYPFSR